MREIIIDPEKCTGCGICVSSCLYGALSIENDTAKSDPEICTICGACKDVCPSEAIVLAGGESRKQTDAPDDHHGVWVFAEQWKGQIDEAAFELLTKARDLARDLGEQVCAVLAGSEVDDPEELIRYGADTVWYLKDPCLELADEEICSRLMADLILEKKPEIVLFAATPFGRSMAPRVSAQLQTGLTADCTKLAIDKKQRLLLQTRPAFGGNVMADIVCPVRRPQMATVRPGVFKKSLPEAEKAGELRILPVRVRESQIQSRILEVVEITERIQRIEDAKIVVAGGAGMSSKEDFELVRQLAEALGGCVGASRAAVELGYAGYESQVGQTGKVIAPKLYIACGISGAIQHVLGMENAEYIAAVNSDPDAAIFQVADVGIVGDVKVVLPALIENIKAAKKGRSE